MTDREFATELVNRLQRICEDAAVKSDVASLLRLTIEASPSSVAHPSIVCGHRLPDATKSSLRLLGLLNGLFEKPGVIGADVTADDKEDLLRFWVTEDRPDKPELDK